MDDDTTIPSAIMPRDSPPQEKRVSNSHPILKILLLGVVLVILFVLFKR